MKEKLYEIPLNDAVNEDDECFFCFIERKMEQELLDYVLGSCASYMESDTREKTDQAGFCREHQKKMFDYGNALGNGWILKTYYDRTIKEMREQFKQQDTGKISFMDRLKAKSNAAKGGANAVADWIDGKEGTCYICDHFQSAYERYIAAFFHLYQKDASFRAKIAKGKGVCLHHFKDLCRGADRHLNDPGRREFYEMMFSLMEQNMERVSADIRWFVDKFDYKNKDADWKTSKDALQRGMQKIRGGYPADPVYKMK